MADRTTLDGVLGGRVRLHQPATGYRAATDPVLLAAAVPAWAGERVLDVGCGVGAALYCLAARVPGLGLAGVEVQAAYADLACRNAGENGVAARIWTADIAAPPKDLVAEHFDQVMTNPPFYPAGTMANDRGRARAHHEDGAGVAQFLDFGLRRLRPGGTLTVIYRAERLDRILGALTGRAGAIRVLPLTARAGRPAKRVIVQAVKGAGAPLTLFPPLILHAGPAHRADAPDPTPEAAALMQGAGLDMASGETVHIVANDEGDSAADS